MIQLGGFLSRHLGPLLRTGFPWIGNILKLLTEGVLIPLGLEAASTAEAGMHKKYLMTGHPSNLAKQTLLISNEKMDDVIKIVKCFEECVLSINQLKMKDS